MQRLTTTAALVFSLAVLAGPVSAGPGTPGHGHDNGTTFSVGEPGDPKKPSRPINVAMREREDRMVFFPDRIEVKRGEQVKFVLRNSGELEHELVLGTAADLQEHAELMKKYPDMEHDDPNAKRLKPKQSGEIVWKFTKAGTFVFGCLIPGHLEAGMKGTIVVK